MISSVFDILLGSFFIVLSLMSGFEFVEARLGTRQKPTRLGPAWIGRVIFFFLGLGIALDGIHNLRHH
jgi:hypothetical protein